MVGPYQPPEACDAVVVGSPVVDTVLEKVMSLREEVRAAINRASADNGSDTPDFILADYLLSCLDAFDKATIARDRWWNHKPQRAWLGWMKP